MSLQFPEHFIRSKVFAFKRVAAFEDSLRFLALSGLGHGGGGGYNEPKSRRTPPLLELYEFIE